MRRDINQPDTLYVVVGDTRYYVEWRKIPPGGSIFLPVVRGKSVLDQVTDICNHLRLRMVYQERIEGGKYGLRFWRV